MVKKIKIKITVKSQEELWLLKKKLGLVDGKMPKFKEYYENALFG